MSHKPPCENCGLRYSSYCIGCQYVKSGLGLTDKEYEGYLKTRKNPNDEELYGGNKNE